MTWRSVNAMATPSGAGPLRVNLKLSLLGALSPLSTL